MGNTVFRIIFICALVLLFPFFLSAQDLSLSPGDLSIELRPDGGYHLFIRFKPDISSVLLTESTRDPEFREPNYAYRTAEWNEINGDEIRLIDGFPIPAASHIFSLVSSTPVRHPVFGWAYHIYIPHVIFFGYEDGRHGEVQVGDGTYLNIRAFHYAFADYRGPFEDNPFVLRVTQESRRPVPEGNFLRETVDAFTRLALENSRYSNNPGDMMDQLREIFSQEEGNDVDIVVVLDVTGSMRPYFNAIRSGLIPLLQEMLEEFASYRAGLVFYKDYGDDFLNRVFPFSSDFSVIQNNINAVRPGGGGDIPEAVYEALYAAATRLEWESDRRIMILIGDAPPHPRPRGNVTREMAEREIEQRGIEVHSIILPHP